MEWGKLFVDFVDAIAWPAVVLTIALTFKDDLKRLFPRMRKAGPTGVEFDVQASVALESSKWSGELREIPGLVRTETIADLEKRIHQHLQMYASETRIDLLVRHLAQAQIQLVFERIYGVIYGTQIDALRALQRGGGKVTREDARKYFEEHVASRPEHAGKEADAWINFMIHTGLTTEKDGVISISPAGKDFLLYVDGVHPGVIKPS